MRGESGEAPGDATPARTGARRVRPAATPLGDAAAQSRRLLTLASALSEAVGSEAIADTIFRETLGAVGADAGSLALLDRGGAPGSAAHAGMMLDVVRTHGYTPAAEAAFRRFPVHPDRPASDAALSREPVLLRDRAEWAARLGEGALLAATTGFEAYAGVPIISGDRVLGVLSFSFRQPRTFDAATRTFLVTLGHLCGQALERARAFDAERRARDRTETILRAIGDGFIAVDRELRYTYVNDRVAELLGRPASELLGRSWAELFPEGRRSPLGATLRARMAAGETGSIEEYSRMLQRWLDVRYYPAPDGYVLLVRDVTEQRRAQDAAAFLAEASRVLSSSMAYDETLRNIAAAAVPRLGDWCAVDLIADPTRAEWPPVLERVAIVHQDPEKVAFGRAFRDMYPEDWSSPSGLARVLRDGAPVYIPEVTEAMLAAGARDARHLEMLRTLRFSAIIIVPLAARGRTLGAITLAASESGRRYTPGDLGLAEELGRRAGVALDNARLLRDAEAGNAAKTEFLRTVSHELRQPLNGIGGFLELLEMGLRGPLTELQREDLARIRRNQQHLLTLINDLLSFARLEAGQLEIARSVVPVDALLRSVEAMVLPQMDARGVRYAYTGCDPHLAAYGDQDRVVQIVLNLLTNALKATGAGGTVTLGGESVGSHVVITVRDTGVGIPADKQEAIFSPFTQLGRALNSPQEGAGLGLSISRGLAEAMNGSLHVESTVGSGSTFTLRLPRAGDDMGA